MCNLVIKTVATEEEYQDVQRLHREIWGLTDLEVIPGHLLQAVQAANGLVLCAYDGDIPVGFSFGFCGIRDDGSAYLHSHNLGVIERYRSMHIGERIKWQQRKIALARCLDLIAWTFDPLESINAYLNLHKLGCVARTYIRDYYGAMQDRLNENIPSDRLIAEWWIGHSWVTANATTHKSDSRKLPNAQLNHTRIDKKGLLHPLAAVEPVPAHSDGVETISVEVPANYQSMRLQDSSLAMEWRYVLRDCFEACFARNWVATDFMFEDSRAYYLFSPVDCKCIPAPPLDK